MRLHLIISMLLFAGTSAAIALGAGSGMPDISRQYFQRSNCHQAYDVLAEDVASKRPVGAAERDWAVAYEAAATAGKPCSAAPDSLAKRAINRIVSTRDGLGRVGQFIKAKDPSAYFEAGTAIINDKVPNIPKSDGVGMIRQAAELGDPAGQFMLAMFRIAGVFGTKDYAGALPLLEASAAQGHVDSQFQVGNFYKEGIGTRKDAKKAFDYYRQAAEHGHAYAAMMAFYMIQDGEGTPKDFKLAYRIARNLADQGETVGAVLAASALLQQRNAKDNENEVLYWMDTAIRNGDDSIRAEVGKFRPQVVAAFKRANAPPEYVPRVRKECPLKTVCLVDRYSGARSCTTNKDYWSDCDL